MTDTKWLIAREIPRLRRYALTLVGDPVLADDLVQDTLERAIRKRYLWRRRGSLRGWLYRILHNVFLNQSVHRRRRRNEVDLDEAPEEAAPCPQETRLECREIAAAMAQLPAEQRVAIALVAIEGLAYDEASSVLGIPIGTLRSRIARGRERLRELCPTELAEPAEPAEPARPPATHLRRVK